MTIKRIARAKINLSLHVVGQRSDGYHLLDSIVAFAEFGDELTFSHSDVTQLTIDGPFSDGLSGADDNLVLKAARCFETDRGASVRLTKNLPVASGIGGGSADAAAALHGLSALWDCPFPDAETVLELGADVPVCASGGVVRMRGIGERIEPVTGLCAYPMVLINPGVGVSTPEVFRALKDKDNSELPAQTGDVLDWLRQQRNDLQEPAIALEPVIGSVLQRLAQSGAELSRMSGSGATCFGLFENDALAQAAARQIAEDQPDWWVQTTRLTT